MHRSFVIALVVPLAAVTTATSPARATPPDTEHVTLAPMCASEHDIVMMATASTNQGTYYNDQHHWWWVAYTPARHAWRLEPVATLQFSTIDEPDHPQMVRRQDQEGKLAALLGDVGAIKCGLIPEQEFRYTLKGRQLYIHYEGVRRKLTRLKNVRNSIGLVAYNPYRFAPTTRLEFCIESDECESAAIASYRTPAWTILVVTVADEDNLTTADLLVPLTNRELDAAKSRAANTAGFRLHKKQAYEQSAHLFGRATGLDPTYTTARYNLACAHARLGQLDQAISTLKPLRDQAGIRAKIRGDTDFAGALKNSEFRSFVDALPGQ